MIFHATTHIAPVRRSLSNDDLFWTNQQVQAMFACYTLRSHDLVIHGSAVCHIPFVADENDYEGTLPESRGIGVAEAGERQNNGPYSEARAHCGQEGHQSKSPQVGHGLPSRMLQ